MTPSRAGAGALALVVGVTFAPGYALASGGDGHGSQEARAADRDQHLVDQDLAARGPMPPDGYMERAIRLVRAKRFDEARAMLEPVVAAHPGWAKAHFYLALSYHEQHRYEMARGLYERTLELDPDYEPPRLFFGWCLYYLGELERSRQMFESFLTARPDYPDAIFALGLLDFDADAIDAARARFVKVAELAAASDDASTEAKARARLADVDLRVGDLAAARGQLERSLELNPHNYETWFKLSRVLQRMGDEEGAQRARARHDEVRAARRGASGDVKQETR